MSVVEWTLHVNGDYCHGGKFTPRELGIASVRNREAYTLFLIRSDYRLLYSMSDMLLNKHISETGHFLPFLQVDKEILPSAASVCEFIKNSFPDTTVFGCWSQSHILRNLFGIRRLVDISGNYEMTDETAPTLYPGHHIDDRTVRCSLRLAWEMARVVDKKQQQQQQQQKKSGHFGGGGTSSSSSGGFDGNGFNKAVGSSPY